MVASEPSFQLPLICSKDQLPAWVKGIYLLGNPACISLKTLLCWHRKSACFSILCSFFSLPPALAVQSPINLSFLPMEWFSLIVSLCPHLIYNCCSIEHHIVCFDPLSVAFSMVGMVRECHFPSWVWVSM